MYLIIVIFLATSRRAILTKSLKQTITSGDRHKK